MNHPPADRQRAIEALRANPIAQFTADHLARLSDPGFDVTFEELGMDSLAMMELSIWLEVECGIEVTEEDIREMSSLSGLARYLRDRQGGTTAAA